MTLAARCTHCHTVFRISGPQLAAAQGWVRCGGCGQVFDASANLVTSSGQALEVPTVDTRANEPLRPPEAPASPTVSNRAEAVDAGRAAALPFQAMPDIDLELPDLGELKAEAAQHQTTAVGLQPVSPPEAAPHSESASVVHGADLATASPPEAAALPDAARDEREPFWVDPGVVGPAAIHSPGGAQAALPGDGPPAPVTGSPTGDLRGPLGDHHAAPKTVESTTGTAAERRLASALSPLAALGLCLSLLALSAYALRGHIAQAWPETRPLVLQACAVLGCKLPPMRLIDSVSVQGSSLSLDDSSGHHRLRIQLRNTADGPVFMPAFDFSLVDGNGQVLARRMLDATEFEPAMARLDAESDADLAIALDLRALDAAAIASFRVVPHYP